MALPRALAYVRSGKALRFGRRSETRVAGKRSDFTSIHAHGFVRVGVATPLVAVADPTANAESAKELAETKRELAAAKKQIDALQQQLKSFEGMDSQHETIAELEQDRADLEAELSLVRDRAEELYNKVREQKEELHDQRDALMSELKQLRRVVERQAELLAESRGGRTSDGASHVIKSVERDPVLDSVTSQFARLHKDATSRRSKPPRRERPE